MSGVIVDGDGLGTLEDNDITGNTWDGVTIGSGGNPTVRGNRINRNSHSAVRAYYAGRGVVEDNDLTGNEQGAWLIEESRQTNVTRARNRE